MATRRMTTTAPRIQQTVTSAGEKTARNMGSAATEAAFVPPAPPSPPSPSRFLRRMMPTMRMTSSIAAMTASRMMSHRSESTSSSMSQVNVTASVVPSDQQ